MSEGHKKGLNAGLIEDDLMSCCKRCDQCQGKACTIGFAKKCVWDYIRKPKKEVADGVSHIPVTDFKVYDEVELETAIAHILKECKDCKEEHTQDCIINVIRGCYEVGLMGEVHAYEGSALQYLMYLRENFPERAGKIADIYAGL